MAKRTANKQAKSDGNRPGTRVEYNLEKPPLQTGQTAPRTDPREQVTMGARPWVVRRRMAAFLALFLIALMIVAGVLLIDLLSDVIPRYYSSGT